MMLARSAPERCQGGVTQLGYWISQPGIDLRQIRTTVRGAMSSHTQWLAVWTDPTDI